MVYIHWYSKLIGIEGQLLPDNSGTIDDEDEALVSTSCIVQCEEEQLTLLDSNQLQEAELNTEVPSESECCTDESLEQESQSLSSF